MDKLKLLEFINNGLLNSTNSFIQFGFSKDANHEITANLLYLNHAILNDTCIQLHDNCPTLKFINTLPKPLKDAIMVFVVIK